MFGGISPTEIIVIGLVLVVLFGGKKLTEMAGTLGKTTKELKKIKEEYKNVLSESDGKQSKPTTNHQ